ncbi:hypothetical protein [uncultured Brevundimonas sp.]|uniref:hypothetical protein n=1 Tax=uncultured Brevundimonas sp. TaxID=213418 RepID=UPI0025D11222|nr:hypothetical protein [uncultured Brevundimonas sp.]
MVDLHIDDMKLVGKAPRRSKAATLKMLKARLGGASGLMLAPVAYTSPREEEFLEHFLAVASASGLPLYV